MMKKTTQTKAIFKGKGLLKKVLFNHSDPEKDWKYNTKLFFLIAFFCFYTGINVFSQTVVVNPSSTTIPELTICTKNSVISIEINEVYLPDDKVYDYMFKPTTDENTNSFTISLPTGLIFSNSNTANFDNLTPGDISGTGISYSADRRQKNKTKNTPFIQNS